MTRLFAGTPFDRPPVCDRCERLVAECTCPPEAATPQWQPANKQTANLRVEKRAKGKLVTVIRGLSPAATDFAALVKQLKAACGAGGSIDEDLIEVQGDHLAKIRGLLGDLGYRVKG